MEQWQIITVIYITANLIVLVIVNHFDPLDDGSEEKQTVFFGVIVYALVLIPVLLVALSHRLFNKAHRLLRRGV